MQGAHAQLRRRDTARMDGIRCTSDK